VNSCGVLGTDGHLDLSDLGVALRSSNETPFRRADFNQSGAVDISDAVATFGYLFLGAAAPSCLDAADSNGDGSLDISDGVNSLNFLFTGGTDIPAPGPVACGLAEASGLGCDSFLCGG
jgi:hypothetical protein